MLLEERYEKKYGTGGFQTEHEERHQSGSMTSVFQHQPEETIRNGVQGSRPWLDGTPEEKAERRPPLHSQAFLPSVVFCQSRKPLK